MRLRRFCWLLVLGGGCLLSACGTARRTEPVGAVPAGAVAGPNFRDVAGEAGVTFALGHPGKSPLTVLDTAPGGCAWADLDGDGWLDLVLVGPSRAEIYRNLGNGRFQDISREIGFTKSGSWMGCTVGDYDNDGDPDLLVTGYRCLALWRNDRGKRLVEVAGSAGVKSDQWTTSAGFADLDGDGCLDLYVAAYLDYRLGTKDLCVHGAGVNTACGPEAYAPERGRLYRNRHDGRFDDITETSGVGKASGKTWGVAFADYDDDGKTDLYLANDQEPGNLFHNEGSGRFVDRGLDSGTAYDAIGHVQGGMGVDWADFSGDGRLDLFVTTYVQQDKQLYRNERRGLFHPVSREMGMTPAQPYVAFGCGFFDADNDGLQDLLIANGHIRDNAGIIEPSQSYPQPLQFFLARPDGVFQESSKSAGPTFGSKLVGRGVAFGDYDKDGRVDAVVVDLEGRARLLHNESRSVGNWLSVRLRAKSLNREGIGARVVLEAAGRRQVREVTRARGVLSASDAAVHFGLGSAAVVDRLLVRWPDGTSEEWNALQLNREVEMVQGAGRRSGGRQSAHLSRLDSRKQ